MTGVKGAATLDGWTERLAAHRDPAGSWQFRATTSGPWVTLVSRDDGAYYERRCDLAPAGGGCVRPGF